MSNLILYPLNSEIKLKFAATEMDIHHVAKAEPAQALTARETGISCAGGLLT